MNLHIFLLIVLSLTLYGSFLDHTPVHLNQDEMGFALNAHSIAKTGFDENGRFLPLYFWHLGVMWATPIIVYLTALVLKVFPLSETAIRLPSVFIGVTNVVLIWFLAKRVLKSDKWAHVSSIILMLTPVQFIQSRILLDNLYPVPFILGWLLCLHMYLEDKKTWKALLGVLMLGIGIHSYHATKIMMPLYFVATFAVVWPQIKKARMLGVYLFLAFALPILPLFFWLKAYPDTLVDQVKYTGIYDTSMPAALGFISLLSPQSLLHRLDIFVNFFNPTFLFLKGDVSLIHSTQRSGVFLLPLLLFLPIGIVIAWQKRTVFEKLIIFGFFTSPLAATVAGDHFRISRALFILPFAILLATHGARWLYRRNKKLALGLLFLVPLQFSVFWYNYMEGYRFRSYQWFNYNTPGALEAAIKHSEGKEHIFLDQSVGFIDRYWRFYTIMHKKTDLQEKVVLFDPYNLENQNFPPNSLLVVHFSRVDGKKEQMGNLKKIENITEIDGVSTYFLYSN